jgi:hypothetical protein
MSGYLSNIVTKTFAPADVLRPLVPALFESPRPGGLWPPPAVIPPEISPETVVASPAEPSRGVQAEAVAQERIARVEASPPLRERRGKETTPLNAPHFEETGRRHSEPRDGADLDISVRRRFTIDAQVEAVQADAPPPSNRTGSPTRTSPVLPPERARANPAREAQNIGPLAPTHGAERAQAEVTEAASVPPPPEPMAALESRGQQRDMGVEVRILREDLNRWHANDWPGSSPDERLVPSSNAPAQMRAVPRRPPDAGLAPPQLRSRRDSRPGPASPPPSETVIEVTIGRIEVRGPARPETVKASPRPSSGPSLDEYLRRRSGRSGA